MHLMYYDGVFGEQGSANAAIQLIKYIIDDLRTDSP